MRPETAISKSAPISGPRSRAPQQIQRQIAQPSPNRIEQFGRPEKRTYTKFQEDQESMTNSESREMMDSTKQKISSRNGTHQPNVRASEMVDPRVGRTAISRDQSTPRPSSGAVFGAPTRYTHPPAPNSEAPVPIDEGMNRIGAAFENMAPIPTAGAATMTGHRDKRRRASQPESEGPRGGSLSSVQLSTSQQARISSSSHGHRQDSQGSIQSQPIPMATHRRDQRLAGDWVSLQSAGVAGAYSRSPSVHIDDMAPPQWPTRRGTVHRPENRQVAMPRLASTSGEHRSQPNHMYVHPDAMAPLGSTPRASNAGSRRQASMAVPSDESFEYDPQYSYSFPACHTPLTSSEPRSQASNTSSADRSRATQYDSRYGDHQESRLFPSRSAARTPSESRPRTPSSGGSVRHGGAGPRYGGQDDSYRRNGRTDMGPPRLSGLQPSRAMESSRTQQTHRIQTSSDSSSRVSTESRNSLDDSDYRQGFDVDFISRNDGYGSSRRSFNLHHSDAIFDGRQPLAPQRRPPTSSAGSGSSSSNNRQPRPTNDGHATSMGPFSSQSGNRIARGRVRTGEQQLWRPSTPQQVYARGRIEELMEGDDAENPIELD
ncbi:MAG: hypothetical protein Q9174_003864 [Haloplaca sp. 1 TL-2023]